MPLYVVTDRAGPWVAGRRVAPGDVLDLSLEEAAYDLSLGSLLPQGGQLHPALAGPSEAADRLRAMARGGEPEVPLTELGEPSAPKPAAPAERAARRAQGGEAAS